MPLLTVELSPQAERLLERELANADFADKSRFVNEALLAWERQDYERKVALLRERLAEGLAQCDRGEFAEFSIDDMMLEVERDLEDENG